MFEDFLKTKHCELHPMVLDDDLTDSFDNWISQLDQQELIDYAEEAIKFYLAKGMGSIKSEKKAKSSAKNGKMGGRPRFNINTNC